MSRSSVGSSLSKTSKVEAVESDELLAYQGVSSKEDVIRTFFNQIVEFAIEDMTVIEPETVKLQPSESSIVVKDVKDLSKKDLEGSVVSAVEGSKVSLKKKTSSRLSAKRSKMGTTSRLSVIQEDASSDKKTGSSSSTLPEGFFDEERYVRITFVNGNSYEGQIKKRVMNGKGVYKWSDGTIYEGDFLDGFPTGQGEMMLPDLSRYYGGFNQGLFHGDGFFNIVSTPSFYSGQWKDGKKHGKGWMLYEPDNWYEGGWCKNLRDGFGIRSYKNGSIYRGYWKDGLYEGQGTMIWDNHDYYKGEWSKGLMHGQGEYIWKAFFNDTFSFPAQNMFRGTWSEGKRNGEGMMFFGGDSCARIKGTWYQDFKHGDGYLICGNGTIVDKPNLFTYDKPLVVPECASIPESDSCHCTYEVLELPVFALAEDVDVGHYIDKVLEKLTDVNAEKLAVLKMFEAQCVKNTLTNFLLQLKGLYKEYAGLYVKKKIQYPIYMFRMCLWQFYKDLEIHNFGLSLIDIDNILAENPKSALGTLHYPFEPIFFYQFLMSLVGVALRSCPLDEELEEPPSDGVCAFIIKKFLEEVVFGKPRNRNSLVMSYLDLAPIKSVYSLYLKLGEPHSAKTFLQNCCIRKGEVPLLCHLEVFHTRNEPKFGENVMPLLGFLTFMTNKEKQRAKPRLGEENRHNWMSLFDLRHLGAKNVLRCLSEVCPLIVDEGQVVNIDYPLTFLEFYETLLSCIFKVVELELKKEKRIMEQLQIKLMQEQKRSKDKTSLRSGESVRSVNKKEKRGGKGKKKSEKSA